MDENIHDLNLAISLSRGMRYVMLDMALADDWSDFNHRGVNDNLMEIEMRIRAVIRRIESGCYPVLVEKRGVA